MKQRETPSALLILSAIDLLLASLVCAVVLFIALVGTAARGGANYSQTISSSAAPITLHILFLRQPSSQMGVAPTIFDVEGAEELGPPVAASPDSLSAAPLRLWSPGSVNGLHWWTLVVKQEAVQLTFSGIPQLAIATVNLGTEGMYYLALRCGKPNWSLKLSLHPVRVIDETCAARDGMPPFDSPLTPQIVVTTSSASTPAWRHLAQLKNQSGMVSKWVGADRAIPTDASTIVFTD